MTAYLSICSGIEAATVAWHPLGFRPLAFSEIEAFPRAVLGHHYPDVPCHGDFTALRGHPWIVDADILVGGTPCQAFSVAGLRKSLDDDRGNLSLEFVRLADAIDDLRLAAGRKRAIIVWENVPGVLSVRDNAFGCFIAAMAGGAAPYVPPGGKWTNAGVVDGPARTVAWRILDAQYFGLAQRRRRVFVVASARAGFDPAAVLLEFEGLRRDTPPRREAREIAPTIPARSLGGGGLGTDFDCDGGVIEASTGEISHCLNAGGQMAVAVPLLEVGKRTGPSSTDDLRAGLGIGEDGDPMFTLQAGAQHGVAAYAFQPRIARNGRGDMGDIVNALNAQSGETGKGDAAPCVAVAYTLGVGANQASGFESEVVAAQMAVRRLTPVEAERLQGFPDGYTAIPWRGKPAADCPDGPRYKALGNSMAVPVMRWIGRRIAAALEAA